MWLHISERKNKFQTNDIFGSKNTRIPIKKKNDILENLKSQPCVYKGCMCSFSITLCGCRDRGTIVYTRSGSDWIDWFNGKMITYMSRSTAPFVSGLNSSSIYMRLDRIPRSTWARHYPGKQCWEEMVWVENSFATCRTLPSDNSMSTPIAFKEHWLFFL